jgi:esterase/lipase
VGVVLVHGYLAAPFEVRELPEHLGRRGLWVYAPRLKGHGTSPEDLAHRTYMEWVRSVEEGYVIISNLCKKVVLGGFSTGAGLTLDLAARIPEVEAVFVVCPPMRLQDFSSRIVPAMGVWSRFMETVNIMSARKEFVANRPENPSINYFRNPIAGVREVERFMVELRPKLAQITVPALVVQSHGDPVVDHRGSQRVFELLGSRDKEFILFNMDRHGILIGEGAQRVRKVIADFIEHVTT